MDYKTQKAARPRLAGPDRDWIAMRRPETGISTVLCVQPTGNCSFLGAIYRYREVLFIILREKFRNIPGFGRERYRGRAVVLSFLLLSFRTEPDSF